MFCLATGRLVRFAIESWKVHEIPLARLLISWVEPGDILLADRGFAAQGLLALLWRKKVDVIMRAHQARKIRAANDLEETRSQSPDLGQGVVGELPMRWSCASCASASVSPVSAPRKICWSPPCSTPRPIPITRSPSSTCAVGASSYSFATSRPRSVSTCCAASRPDMVEKEIWMQALAYNLIRALMLEAALTTMSTSSASASGAPSTPWNQWTPAVRPARMFSFKHARAELLRVIAADQIPDRPNRSEPRAKRRPKPINCSPNPATK